MAKESDQEFVTGVLNEKIEENAPSDAAATFFQSDARKAATVHENPLTVKGLGAIGLPDPRHARGDKPCVNGGQKP